MDWYEDDLGEGDLGLSENKDDDGILEIEPDADIAMIEESLAPTWSVLTDVPGFDDIMEQAGPSLEGIEEYFQYELFRDAGDADTIYLCRYEFIRSTGAFEHPDGIMSIFPGNKIIYLDFITGFPLFCIELSFVFGEYSSRYSNEQKTAMQSTGVTPPVPASFFGGYAPNRILNNITAMDRKLDANYYGVVMADGLQGTSQPDGAKWWLRNNIQDTEKFPIPGEFVGLGVRLMPGEYSGKQFSSPFVYAGNWIDYVWYTGGKVVAVELVDDIPYVTVQWRKHVLRLKSSDYADYAVGDRVTILKIVDTNKVTQTWEDLDTQEPDSEQWVVVPVMFYGLEYGGA